MKILKIIVILVLITGCQKNYAGNITKNSFHTSTDFNGKIDSYIKINVASNDFSKINSDFNFKKKLKDIIEQVFLSVYISNKIYFDHESIDITNYENYTDKTIKNTEIISQIIKNYKKIGINDKIEFNHNVKIKKLALLDSHFLVKKYIDVLTRYYDSNELENVIHIGDNLKYHFDRHDNSIYYLIYYNTITFTYNSEKYYLNYYYSINEKGANLLYLDMSNDLTKSDVFELEGDF